MHRTRWAHGEPDSVQNPVTIVRLPNLYDLKARIDVPGIVGFLGPCDPSKLPEGFDSATINWEIGEDDAVVGGVPFTGVVSHTYPDRGQKHLYIEYFGESGSLGITFLSIGPDGTFYLES